MPEPVGRARGAVALVAGRYELLRELSDAGEFQDWQGFDSALERVVVVRLAPHDAAPHSPTVERFWQAARASASANSPAGERVLDAGRDPDTGRAFLVCEWPTELSTDQVPPVPRSRTPTNNRLKPGRLVLPAAVLALFIAVVMIGRGLGNWLSWVNAPLGAANSSFVLPPAQVATPRPTVLATATVAAEVTAPATPKPTATTVRNAGVSRRVVNTDGRGVALRDGPNGNRLPGKGYDEGATVTAFESSGGWTRIRGADGREGWVLSVTLAP